MEGRGGERESEKHACARTHHRVHRVNISRLKVQGIFIIPEGQFDAQPAVKKKQQEYGSRALSRLFPPGIKPTTLCLPDALPSVNILLNTLCDDSCDCDCRT